MPALCALPLVLASGCTDNLLGPISPQGAGPSYAAAWTETEDSVLIDFEAIPVFGGARSYLTGAGVRFPDWMWVIDPAVPNGGYYDYGLTPPTSGNHAIGLGYFQPERFEGDVLFFVPVAAVSLSVRAAGDFVITCYNAAGVELGSQVAAGWNYLTDPLPVRAQRLSIRAPGISLCRLSVAGGTLDDFSFRRTQPPKLKLECLGDLGMNRVTRGRDLQCRVSASDSSAALTDTRWVFEDSAGRKVNGPPGSDRWRGPMVIGGRVRVSALVDGQPDSTDAVLTVRARSWPPPSIVPHEEPATHLPLPVNVTAPGHLGDTHVDSTATPPLTGIRINDGPNAGWWYIPQPMVDIPVTVHINYAAFQSGSAWYNLQTGGAWTNPTSGITHPNGYCNQAQVPTLLRLTREHEGSAPSSVMSHIRAMRVYVAGNAPQDTFEELIAWDADVQTFTFAETIGSAYRAYIIGNLTGHSAHVSDPVPGVVPLAIFPCAARPWR